MYYFKTHTGELINPANVTHVTVGKEAGVFVLKYNFTSGKSKDYTFERHQTAVEQLADYENHCYCLEAR